MIGEQIAALAWPIPTLLFAWPGRSAVDTFHCSQDDPFRTIVFTEKETKDETKDRRDRRDGTRRNEADETRRDEREETNRQTRRDETDRQTDQKTGDEKHDNELHADTPRKAQ